MVQARTINAQTVKIYTAKYSWKRHSQTHNICTGFKVYIPEKLDTKSYKLDPSLKTNYIHKQSLMTGKKLCEWALHEIQLPIPKLSPHKKN